VVFQIFLDFFPVSCQLSFSLLFCITWLLVQEFSKEKDLNGFTI